MYAGGSENDVLEDGEVEPYLCARVALRCFEASWQWRELCSTILVLCEKVRKCIGSGNSESKEFRISQKRNNNNNRLGGLTQFEFPVRTNIAKIK